MTRPFHFKRFSVVQRLTPMKVGTDGVVLGAWAPVRNAQRILDIGTGTGLLALMMAQRAPQATVVGIEPHEDACEEARHNAAESPFADRIEVIHTDAAGFRPPHSFDLIVCNPPFFERDLPSPDAGRTAARHASTLSPFALATAALRLAPAGRLCTIYPPAAHERLREAMSAAGRHETQRTLLRPTPDKPVHRVLSEFSADGSTSRPADTWAIRSHGGGPYSDQHRRLTSDFYLDR